MAPLSHSPVRQVRERRYAETNSTETPARLFLGASERHGFPHLLCQPFSGGASVLQYRLGCSFDDPLFVR